MALISGVRPVVGDLVLMPRWLAPSPTWFRVLGVRPPVGAVPGWCHLDGYLILPDGRQRLGSHFVPIAALVVDRS
ncbi:hypothetical protein [Actinocatenispora rupis]|uniref:Uncharacterized protein n=1 Tax=Actinocatenispora rupis TaxID=519421 RepID=A0A8J3JC28_9ACTN|nr:hypothetical protein [Actinocatenispora rupis]GID15616.1 hypothetical protein Aru02nite_65050 [Actinocatenispora rupis]